VVTGNRPGTRQSKTKKGGMEPLTRKKGETLIEAETGYKTKKINKLNEKKMRKLKKKNGK